MISDLAGEPQPWLAIGFNAVLLLYTMGVNITAWHPHAPVGAPASAK
jgi:hypothetical protein